MEAPKLSFVIPVRNDATRLARCLRSIRSGKSRVPYEILVADNGSTDTSAEVAQAAGASVVSLPDRPVSEVRNAAARTTAGEFLAFVDADHELGPGWIDAAMDLLQRPDVWAAGADYRAPADGTWVQRMYDRLRAHPPGSEVVDWLPSGNLVVRRSAFDRVGGFDTSLESCEDVDFCRRIREAGGTLIGSGALQSVHHGDPETLRALFFSELWRGRDNLRVSLRERLTLRSLPSVAIPPLHLVSFATLGVGLLAAPVVGPMAAVAAAAVAAGLTATRTARLLIRVASSDGRLRHLPSAFAVAAVYDAARAFALVARANHDVRRKG